MNIISKEKLRTMKGKEGLILQGCGGDPKEWLDGINEELTKEGILLDGTKFTDISVFDNEGVTCILYPFDESVHLNVGKLAMWRIATQGAFGGKWLSDYVPNRLGGFTEAESIVTKFYCPLTVAFVEEDNEEDYYYGHEDGRRKNCCCLGIAE